MPKITKEALAKKFYELYQIPLTFDQIASKTGYSKQYVSTILKQYYPEFIARSKSETIKAREESEYLSEQEEALLERLEQTFTAEEIQALTLKIFDSK